VFCLALTTEYLRGSELPSLVGGRAVGGRARKVWAGSAGNFRECSLAVFALNAPTRALVFRGGALYASQLRRWREKATECRPDFCFALTCRLRGESLYGVSNYEATFHSELFPGLPIVGFFAEGEIAVGADNMSRAVMLAESTVLAFVGR